MSTRISNSSVEDAREGELLFLCSRVQPGPECVEEIRQAVACDVNWFELIRMAIPHGLIPLIANNLTRYAGDLTPLRTLDQLEAHRRRTELRNHSQATELVRIVELFSRRGIRSLPFKGPALAVAAYGDLSLRESHDLDIWVHPSQLEEAGNILRAENYRGAGHTRGTVHLLKRDGGGEQSEFLNIDKGVLIELHDELQSSQFSFSPDFEDVWSRRVEISIEGASIAAMCPEDLLITLAVHGSKHLWRRLSWLVDIQGLLERSAPLEWDQVIDRASQWHAKRRLRFACALVENLLGASFTETVRRGIGSRVHGAVSIQKMRSHILCGVEERSLPNFLSELRFQVSSADTFTDRLRILSSYSKKIVKVDETRMLRSMNEETRTLYRLSKGLRLLLARLVN